MTSKFTNWKERSSQVGKIMTNLLDKSVIEKLKPEIKILQDEFKLGVNANGNKVKWTDNKADKLAALIEKRDKKDELPTGAKTHLDDVFNQVFWNRRRMLTNKYLDKGNIGEEDGLGLISELDDVFYIKNTTFYQNDFTHGTPDNVTAIVRDIKCNWDKESFDNAELSTLYMWQIKDYMWKTKKTKGELCYCLVNNPAHQITEAIKGLWFKMGTPDNENEKWVAARQQIERNMIFDIQKFKDDYPGYQFENTVLDFDIPPIMRSKRFNVELLPEDIVNIKRRVTLSRIYLMEKEKEVITKINSVK